NFEFRIPKTKILTNMKSPVLELSDCIKCGVCLEICPAVFRMTSAGFIDVIELGSYPESGVNDAIKYCPMDCIYWEE
ncbi:MAG: ferredoxin, partial [Desulfobacterales bacterium]